MITVYSKNDCPACKTYRLGWTSSSPTTSSKLT